MISLFESYTTKGKDLAYSLKTSGYQSRTIVLQDNGYLPEHVESPFQFFSQTREHSQGQLPLFFNELELPVHWEIQGNNNEAEIFEGYKQRGKIHYSQRKGDLRLIQSVEWWNDQGKCRAIDLYNQYGYRFGHQTYSDGDLSLTTYYDSIGREVIVHNHITGTIQVYYQNQTHIFDSYTSFILFYFEAAHIDTKEILYHSLGVPYFITLALEKQQPMKTFHHTLFWQETSSTMPGNMKSLMQKVKGSTKKIIVQDRKEYERLQEQLNFETSVSITYLGWLYPYRKKTPFTRSVFVYTNSDQVIHLKELCEGLPDYHFHIAARTEMSSKLMNFGNQANISLYPNVTTDEVESLLKETSIYLDINKGSEVENIVRQSFEHQQVILGFRETLHNARYVAPDFVFEQEDYQKMVACLTSVTSSEKKMAQALMIQKQHAGQETIENYQKVIGNA